MTLINARFERAQGAFLAQFGKPLNWRAFLPTTAILAISEEWSSIATDVGDTFIFGALEPSSFISLTMKWVRK